MLVSYSAAPPPPPEKKVFIKKGSKAGSPALEVPSEVPEVRPIEPADPIFIPLPKLKVEHFYDPETGDEVMTREDLVVVIKSERKKSTFVQHADGTQIYSVITEVCSTPENVMSQGEAMMDQIAEVFPKNPPRIKPEVLRPEGEIASKDEGGEGNEYGERRVSAGAGGTEKKGSVRHTLAVADKKDNLMGKKNPSISKSEGSEKPYIKPSLLDLHPRPVLPEISTTWHIHKEGLAKVQGKVITCLRWRVNPEDRFIGFSSSGYCGTICSLGLKFQECIFFHNAGVMFFCCSLDLKLNNLEFALNLRQWMASTLQHGQSRLVR